MNQRICSGHIALKISHSFRILMLTNALNQRIDTEIEIMTWIGLLDWNNGTWATLETLETLKFYMDYLETLEKLNLSWIISEYFKPGNLGTIKLFAESRK